MVSLTLSPSVSSLVAGQPSCRLLAAVVFGRVRAAVVEVGDAVLVVVALGAAVLVLELIDVLGLVDALVLRVRHLVGVVVEVGTTVLVLEAVAILGLVGALVVDVEHPVLVAVAEVGRERAHREQPQVGRADAAAEAAPAAGGDRPHAVDHEAAGDVGLERVDVRIELGEVIQPAAPEHLDDDVDALVDGVGGADPVQKLVPDLGLEALRRAAEQEAEVGGRRAPGRAPPGRCP